MRCSFIELCPCAYIEHIICFVLYFGILCSYVCVSILATTMKLCYTKNLTYWLLTYWWPYVLIPHVLVGSRANWLTYWLSTCLMYPLYQLLLVHNFLVISRYSWLIVMIMLTLTYSKSFVSTIAPSIIYWDIKYKFYCVQPFLYSLCYFTFICCANCFLMRTILLHNHFVLLLLPV